MLPASVQPTKALACPWLMPCSAFKYPTMAMCLSRPQRPDDLLPLGDRAPVLLLDRRKIRGRSLPGPRWCLLHRQHSGDFPAALRASLSSRSNATTSSWSPTHASVSTSVAGESRNFARPWQRHQQISPDASVALQPRSFRRRSAFTRSETRRWVRPVRAGYERQPAGGNGCRAGKRWCGLAGWRLGGGVRAAQPLSEACGHCRDGQLVDEVAGGAGQQFATDGRHP